jgi:GT2 family glycosyltransferase/glycosyltransferase involved in cell wall biosynthesis
MPSQTPLFTPSGEPSLSATAPSGATPLVSIVIRSMDRATLAQALEAVARQTWPAIEVVLVNAKGEGHSPAGDRCGPFDVRTVRGTGRLSRSQAANAGLSAARGEWICFLDDDDWFEPQHIETLARRLAQEPTAVAAYGGVSCVEVDEDSGETREVMRYNLDFDAARLVVENYLPIHSVLFSREAARRTAGFDETLTIFEDWDFWIQLSRGARFAHVDAVTATYRLGSGDSGLYGNAALQEEYAQRILAKWLPALEPAEWALIWGMCRRGLRLQDSLRRDVDLLTEDLSARRVEVKALRQEIHDAKLAAGLAEQIAEQQRQIAKAAMQAAAQSEKLRREAVAVQLRVGEALRGTMKEYEAAAALLRQEQYTVLRPIARNAKRVAGKVWRRLPAPAQALVRKILGRQAAPIHLAPPSEVPGDGGAADWRQSLAGGAPGAFTVIVFPVIDWHFRIQRPQHLARELARQGHRVLYLSTTFADGAGPADCRLIESPAKNIFLLQLALAGSPPNIYEDPLTTEQAQELADALAWLQQAADLGPLVSLVNLPFWRPVAARLPANLVVYDCMDYHAGFSTNTGAVLDEEELLLQSCDLLMTTSGRLAEMMQAKVPDKPHVLVRNGTEVAHFATAPEQLRIERDGRPVIGYVGAISEWFDVQLVIDMAQLRPDWRFVLVGSTFGCDVSAAKNVANIQFTGEVPYSELPGWVHAFDVCMIPFLINELTSCTNPVKVYEYLSAGKPVIATRMPELEAIADQVYIADDAPGFVRAIEESLRENKREGAAAARHDWAAGHSWQARAAQVSEAVAACLPKVSVIVLCYNNLALTQACLESVERHSLWPHLELIAVDNASSDGTPAWLKEFAASRPWVKTILNDKNLGFAAGNNVGLAAATGDYLVMLNNDTEVSPGWIHGMHRHFVRDPRLGLVGPVTDNIGNEAKIEAGYTDKAGMPAWAAARAVHHAGERMDSRVLAFFCVALRRQVYEQVGGLDESFGLGFFEDDDYCNRARAAGWGLAIAEDVFVHHHLSASFDKIKNSTRQALFEKNKEIYERKWGPWIPHQYREAKGSK